MAQSFLKTQAKLMREYYKYFSKYARGQKPEQKVAWVTAFTPVELLEALDILYYFPESYAAVIAASEKEQPLLAESGRRGLSANCCSYSGCFNGCLDTEDGPRGIPPLPDVLIATNNQCNTLPGWWNVLAQKYGVPLIVLDYPGENCDPDAARRYVAEQHRRLISELEKLSGNTFDEGRLNELLENSARSVAAWNGVLRSLGKKDVDPTLLFDSLSFLITARCRPETADIYGMMAEELGAGADAADDRIPVFWLGYPLWYHADRYLKEYLGDFRIVGSNYVTWWSLDYSGEDAFERLFRAYNYTFLNLTQQSRDERLAALIRASGAAGAIVLHNKSCKCDFVSARNVSLPQAELEIDMIDRTYLDAGKTERILALLKETICTA